MSSDHANPGPTPHEPSTGGHGATIALFVVILALIFAIGTYDRPRNQNGPDVQSGPTAEVGPTVNNHPSTEFPLPDGPNIDDFQNSCLTCHSARLPLGQPPFGREKWSEIVLKMKSAYGAPITPEVQSKIVDYIVKVRPPES